MRAMSVPPPLNEATIIDFKSRNEARFQVLKNTHPSIFVYDQGSRKKIGVQDIILIKASGNYSYLVLDNNETILTSKTIKHWAEQFNSSTLLRIHKTYLINVDKIVSLNMGSHQLTMKENHTAVYARGMKKQLLGLYLS